MPGIRGVSERIALLCMVLVVVLLRWFSYMVYRRKVRI